MPSTSAALDEKASLIVPKTPLAPDVATASATSWGASRRVLHSSGVNVVLSAMGSPSRGGGAAASRGRTVDPSFRGGRRPGDPVR